MIVQTNTQLDEIQISCYAMISGKRQVRDLPVLQIGEVIIHLTFEQAARVHEVTGEFLAGGRNTVSSCEPMKKTVQRR
jgi:hypothetical protein